MSSLQPVPWVLPTVFAAPIRRSRWRKFSGTGEAILRTPYSVPRYFSLCNPCSGDPTLTLPWQHFPPKFCLQGVESHTPDSLRVLAQVFPSPKKKTRRLHHQNKPPAKETRNTKHDTHPLRDTPTKRARRLRLRLFLATQQILSVAKKQVFGYSNAHSHLVLCDRPVSNPLCQLTASPCPRHVRQLVDAFPSPCPGLLLAGHVPSPTMSPSQSPRNDAWEDLAESEEANPRHST